MDFYSAYKVATAVVFSLMTSLWICSLVVKDASIVDRFWGAGFVLIAWAIALVIKDITAIKLALLMIVSIWGLRLSLYIHLRNRGHQEDYRYAEMRSHHGRNFWWYSFLSVFALQGTLMLIVSAPVIFVMSQTEATALTSSAVIGIVLWAAGFIFEAGGDWQLSKFKSNQANKGLLLTSGLWSVTRHPNYFGDALQWWGFGLFAISYSMPGILTLIGPIVMTLFIRKISGVDLLEKSLKNTKPGYTTYITNTPAFFPRWPFWTKLIGFAALSVFIFNEFS